MEGKEKKMSKKAPEEEDEERKVKKHGCNSSVTLLFY